MEFMKWLEILIQNTLSILFIILLLYIIITYIKMKIYKNSYIKGKTIVVVGISSVLYKKLESSLIKRKPKIIFGYFNESIKNEIINSLSEKEKKLTKFIRLDLLDYDSLFNFCQQVKTQCNKIDILYNNFEPINFKDISYNYNKYYEGYFLLTSLLLEHFNENKGKIINISLLYCPDYFDKNINYKINIERFTIFFNQLCEQKFSNISCVTTASKNFDYYFTFLKQNDYLFGYKFLYPIFTRFDTVIDKDPLIFNLCFPSLNEFSSNKNEKNNYNNIKNILDEYNYDYYLSNLKNMYIKGDMEIIYEKIKERINFNLDFMDKYFNEDIKFITHFEYQKNNEINIDEYNKNLIEKLLNEKKNLKIFDSKFIKTNRSNCKLIINGKELELCEEINIENFLENGKLDIKIKQIKPITDMSYMFNYCNSLSFITNLSDLDTSEVTKMSSMFSGCEYIPDISAWNTKNVKDMSSLFENYRSKYLPDISNWDTSNVEDMSRMFYLCLSLEFLPDISKWNTSNVKNIEQMFLMCWNLKAIPDISKWDTSNVNNMSNLISNCGKLRALPDLSKWNTKNVRSMYGMFFQLRLIGIFPDISKWEIHDVDVWNIHNIIDQCIVLNPVIYYRFNKKYQNLNE